MSKNKVYAASYPNGKVEFFYSWPHCQRAVQGKPNIRYKGFPAISEAKAWISKIQNCRKLPQDKTSIRVYVDGSFTPKCSRSGWGWVAVQNGKILHEEYGITEKDAESRNIDGELEAAVRAISWLKTGDLKAVIVHDYAGISEWALGLWKAKSAVAQSYIKVIKQLDYKVAFQKVEGHSGDRWNDHADALAKKGLEDYLKKGD